MDMKSKEVILVKKKYSKPVIYVESFHLSAHIAGCGAGSNSGNQFGRPNHDKGSCAWIDLFGRHLFTNGISACKKTGDNEMYCYNTPSPDNKIFAS